MDVLRSDVAPARCTRFLGLDAIIPVSDGPPSSTLSSATDSPMDCMDAAGLYIRLSRELPALSALMYDAWLDTDEVCSPAVVVPDACTDAGGDRPLRRSGLLRRTSATAFPPAAVTGASESRLLRSRGGSASRPLLDRMGLTETWGSVMSTPYQVGC